MKNHYSNSAAIRWTILAASVVLIFGPYAAYDNPTATQGSLRAWMGGGPSFASKFNTLFSVYSAPNLVLPFVGGILIDTVGVRPMLISLAALVCVGQALFWLGTELKMWSIMYIGRALFGAGTESLASAQNTVVLLWFQGHELALALAIILSAGRLASVVNDNVAPLFGQPQEAYLASLGACGVSLAAGLLIVWIDWSMRGQGRPLREGEEVEEEGDDDGRSKPQLDDSGRAHAPITTDTLHQDVGAGASTALLAGEGEREGGQPHGGGASGTELHPPGKMGNEEKEAGFWAKLQAALRTTARFPWAYWALGLYCIVAWTSVASFNNVAVDYILRHIDPLHASDPPHSSSKEAGFILSIVFIATASVAPFVGGLITAAGYSTPFMLGSGVVVLLLHLFLAGVPALAGLIPLKALFAVLGLAFAVYAAAFWPLVPRVAASGRGGCAALCGLSLRDVVEEQDQDRESKGVAGASIQATEEGLATATSSRGGGQVGGGGGGKGRVPEGIESREDLRVSVDEVAGSAFGTMGAIQNIGLTIVPQLVGLLQPTQPTPEGHEHLGGCSRTYQCVCLLLAGMAAAGLAIGGYMLVWELQDVQEARDRGRASARGGKSAAKGGGVRGRSSEGERAALLGGGEGQA